MRLLPAASSRPRAGAIGLEFAEERLNLVQVRAAGADQFRTVAVASVPYGGSRDAVLEDRQRLRALLTDARRGHRFRGRDVVVSLPADRVRTIPLNYTLQSGESEDAAFLRALQQRVEGALASHIVDYIPIRLESAATNRLAIAVMVERTRTLAFLDQLRYAGLRVRSLEIGPVALRRFVTALMADARDDVVMIINFGSNGSYLTVLSGRRLVFDQQVDFGESTVVERVAGALDVPEEEARALVRRHGFGSGDTDERDAEVRKALIEITRPAFIRFREQIDRAVVFAVSENRGRPVGRVYLGGSLARIDGTSALLAELLSLPVSPLPDPTVEFAGDASTAQARPELAVAAGLALKDMVGASDVDLVPADYRAAATRHRVIVRSVAAAAAGLAACGLGVALLMSLTSELQSEITDLQQSRAITERLQAQLADLQAQRQGLDQRTDQLARLRAHSATVALFQALDRAFVPQRLWLIEWSFKSADAGAPSTMTLRGEAVDHGALSTFVHQLLDQRQVQSVEVVRTTQVEHPAATVVAFEMKVVLGAPGQPA